MKLEGISVIVAQRVNEVALKYNSSHNTFSNGSSPLYSPNIKHISVYNDILAHSNITNNQGNKHMSKSNIDYKNKVEFGTEDVLKLFST